MKIIRNFEPADRYKYDFQLCTYAKGWAQLDTSQDASYFGQWINPTTHEILCYCEGDIILTRCDDSTELAQQVADIKRWNEDHGHRFIGIDPGLSEDFKATLIAAGLGPYLHEVRS